MIERDLGYFVFELMNHYRMGKVTLIADGAAFGSSRAVNQLRAHSIFLDILISSRTYGKINIVQSGAN